MVFSKKILIISLFVIIVVVLAYFIFFSGNPGESEETSAQDSAEESRKASGTPLPVKVAEARRGDLIIKLKSPGEAVTNLQINMKAEVAGVIKSLNVEESKHVRKGELLVVLDDERYRLDLEQEEAVRLVYRSSCKRR